MNIQYKSVTLLSVDKLTLNANTMYKTFIPVANHEGNKLGKHKPIMYATHNTNSTITWYE